jgi:DnaJ-class molecular chaperone
MDDESYYTILGLRPDSSRTAIKQAYKRLVRTCHPDLHPGDPAAERRFKQICRAATVLSDPIQRAAYDRSTGLADDRPDLALRHWETAGYAATAELQVTPAEAAAGVTKTLLFHAADGRPYRLLIPVPPGATAGQRLRLPGKGGPARTGSSRGDLIVIVRIREYATPEFARSIPPTQRRALLLALLSCALVGAALLAVILVQRTLAL